MRAHKHLQKKQDDFTQSDTMLQMIERHAIGIYNRLHTKNVQLPPINWLKLFKTGIPEEFDF